MTSTLTMFVTVPYQLPGDGHLVFGLHCLPDTVPSVAGGMENPPFLSPGYSEETWGKPTGNHELRVFEIANSFSTSLGWKLAVVATKPTYFTT